MGSDHDLAIDVADETTVRGDFNDSEFTRAGITSRFYRRDGKYFVFTEGPGGEMGELEITHTFGWEPLQGTAVVGGSPTSSAALMTRVWHQLCSEVEHASRNKMKGAS